MVKKSVAYLIIVWLLLMPFQHAHMASENEELSSLPLTLDQAQETLQNFRGFFTENKGQWDPEILFVGNTVFGKVVFTRDTIEVYVHNGFSSLNIKKSSDVFHQSEKIADNTNQLIKLFTIELVDHGEISMTGLLPLEHATNYYIGTDSAKWAKECVSYRKISYQGIWNKGELSFYYDEGEIKASFSTQSKQSKIKHRITITNKDDDQTSKKFDVITKRILDLFSAYSFKGKSNDSFMTNHISNEELIFSLESNYKSNDLRGNATMDFLNDLIAMLYSNVELVSLEKDPKLLPAGYSHRTPKEFESTLFGGSREDEIKSIKIGSNGLVYVAGNTDSGTLFGIKSSGSYQDGFIGTLSNDLRELKSLTFFGGNSTDQVNDMLVTKDGFVYIAGTTSSKNLPKTSLGAQTKHAGNTDGFIASFSSCLKELYRSTYLGGPVTEVAPGGDRINMITNSNSGDIYVAGRTSSNVFPKTEGGALSEPSRRYVRDVPKFDGFISRFSSDLSNLKQSTFFYADYDDPGINLDALCICENNFIYIAGSSAQKSLPMSMGGFQEKNPSKEAGVISRVSGYITKFTSDLTKIVQSTFLGGSNNDEINDIKIGKEGHLYVVGTTNSEDFPVKSEKLENQRSRIFLAIVSSSLKDLLQTFRIYADGFDLYNISMVLDGHDEVYITGHTHYQRIWSSYPEDTKLMGLKSNIPGNDDFLPLATDFSRGCLIHVSAGLKQLHQVDFLGEGGDSFFYAIDYSKDGYVYFAGKTMSFGFPGSSGKLQPENAGGRYDGFIGRLKPKYVPKEPDYPILLVHGWQALPYNPLKIWSFMVKELSEQTIVLSENSEVIEKIPVFNSKLNHYVYKIKQKNDKEDSLLFVSDYNPLLIFASKPISGNRIPHQTDIRIYAQNLKKEIDTIKLLTQSEKVNIIAHSMGGLVSRTYIEERAFDTEYAKKVFGNLIGGNRRDLPKYEDDVNQLIMLGTPNHGTQMAKISNRMGKPFSSDNLVCDSQMDTNSEFLKILNYGKDLEWNINNDDLLNEGVKYHVIGSIIPPNDFLIRLRQNEINKHYTTISNYLKNDENRSNLWGENDGLVPANSVRIYDRNRTNNQFGNLNHIYIHADHSQLIRNKKTCEIVIKLLSAEKKKIDTSIYWQPYSKKYRAGLTYRIQQAFIFSPAILSIVSGNETIGFTQQNDTEDAYVDYLNGSILWFDPPNDVCSYELECFEEGSYGIRFLASSSADENQSTSIFEMHDVPSIKGQKDLYHIDWMNKNVLISSDLTGNGEIDRTITPPNPPSALKVSLFNENSVELQWDRALPGSNNLKGYNVFRLTENEENFTSLAFVPAVDALRFVDSAINPELSYSYYIQAMDDLNYTSISSNMVLVSAQTSKTSEIIIHLQIGNAIAHIEKEGKREQMSIDVPPQIIQERTMVPLRFIAEAFGSEVEWIASSKSIRIVLHDTIILMQIGNPTVYINDRQQRIDVPPTIRNERTLVPLRFIAEAFGSEVEWFPTTKEIKITYQQK